MKAFTLALVAALPAALADCSPDTCSGAVHSLLSAGNDLADYAQSLCSSASAATPSQSSPFSSGYEHTELVDALIPLLAPGCNDRKQFASACQCATDVVATVTATYVHHASYTKASSTPASHIVTRTITDSSLVPHKSSTPVASPKDNCTEEVHSSKAPKTSKTTSYSIPSGYSSGVPLSSAVAASIAFVPAAEITASPSGPSTLASPSSSSTSYSIPSGYSSGVPLSSAVAASIAFVPAASIEAAPTGPTTLLTKVSSSSSSSSSSVSVPSGFSSGVPLSSAVAASIAFVPAESITATVSGPTSLAPASSQSVTTDYMLPGASATAKAKRAPGRHTPCPPRQVGLFFDLLTGFASRPCGE